MDKKSKKKKKTKKQRILGALPFVIGALLGILMAEYDIRLIGDTMVTNVFYHLFNFLVAIFISINIHEAGHYFIGRKQGYQLLSYKIGLLTWSYENGRMKFHLSKSKGYGGYCMMIPPKEDLSAGQNALFYLGGILANLILGIVCLLILFLFPGLPQWFKAALWINTLVEIGIGIVNLLPFVSANCPSDGMFFWWLMRGNPEAKDFIVLNQIISQISSGMRPRDVDMKNLKPSQLIDAHYTCYSYFQALDQGLMDEVNQYAKVLEDNLDQYPEYTLPPIYHELCYINCINRSPDTAKAYYKKAGRKLEKDKDVNGLRIKAYYAYYVENDLEKTKTLCEQALDVWDKYPIKGLGLLERDLVLDLQENFR